MNVKKPEVLYHCCAHRISSGFEELQMLDSDVIITRIVTPQASGTTSTARHRYNDTVGHFKRLAHVVIVCTADQQSMMLLP
jgi:hypothetical protein